MNQIVKALIATITLTIGFLLIYNYLESPKKTVLVATGVVEKHTQPLKDIQQVAIIGEGTLYLRQDADSQELRIVADKAAMPYIEISTLDNKLILTYQADKTVQFNTPPPIFYVSLADIAAITAKGVTKITSENELIVDSLDINAHGSSTINLAITTKQFDAKLSGASTIFVTGNATEQHIKLSGATTFNAKSLKSSVASIDASGAFNANIWTTGRLEGSVSGAGKLSYKGNPIVQLVQSGYVLVRKQS